MSIVRVVYAPLIGGILVGGTYNIRRCTRGSDKTTGNIMDQFVYGVSGGLAGGITGILWEVTLPLMGATVVCMGISSAIDLLSAPNESARTRGTHPAPSTN